MTQHFIDIADHDPALLKDMIAQAMKMKADKTINRGLLDGKTVALIFEKPSTRTVCPLRWASVNSAQHRWC